MKKILLISENSPSAFGGIERHCYNIQLLFQDDKNIQILSLSKEQIKYKKVKFINKVLFNERDLIRAIIKSECDVVHVHGFASFAVWQAIKAAIKCGRKIVYTAHFHPFDRLEHPFLGKLFYFFLLKLQNLQN